MNIIQINENGKFTIPAKLRSKYKLQEGNVFTIIDLGDRSFLLKPKILVIDVVSRRIEKRLKKETVAQKNLFKELRKERRRYYQEKYQNGR
ncbi:MAG: hypothetical protein U0V48_05440 [Anaerolineales bacterium]